MAEFLELEVTMENKMRLEKKEKVLDLEVHLKLENDGCHRGGFLDNFTASSLYGSGFDGFQPENENAISSNDEGKLSAELVIEAFDCKICKEDSMRPIFTRLFRAFKISETTVTMGSNLMTLRHWPRTSKSSQKTEHVGNHRQTVPRRRHVGCFHFLGSFAADKLLWWSAKKSEKPAKSRRSRRRGPAARLCRWQSLPLESPIPRPSPAVTHQIRIPLVLYRPYRPIQFSLGEASRFLLAGFSVDRRVSWSCICSSVFVTLSESRRSVDLKLFFFYFNRFDFMYSAPISRSIDGAGVDGDGERGNGTICVLLQWNARFGLWQSHTSIYISESILLPQRIWWVDLFFMIRLFLF
ncbi:hypothetical protein LXL04_002808 [Taraxacum kok-saghyz]